MQFGFILSLLFAIIVTIFAIQNSDSVAINFLFAKVEISQALVIFISAALGAIIVTILGLVRQFKLTRKIKDQEKVVKGLEEEKSIFEQRINELINTKYEEVEEHEATEKNLVIEKFEDNEIKDENFHEENLIDEIKAEDD